MLDLKILKFLQWEVCGAGCQDLLCCVWFSQSRLEEGKEEKEELVLFLSANSVSQV